MKKIATGFSLFLLSLPAFSTTAINLRHEPASFLLGGGHGLAAPFELKEVNRAMDFNQTLHVRLKQHYQGHEVWGGDAVMHIPHANQKNLALASQVNAKTFLNGMVYQGIQQDLGVAPAAIKLDQALQTTIKQYQAEHKHARISEASKQTIVFMDDKQKAHWAYFISFLASDTSELARPTFILDANTGTVYKSWNDIKTLAAGGFGGNHKTGKKIFDGSKGNLPTFEVRRYDNTCYTANNEYVLSDYRTDDVAHFACKKLNAAHNNIYWSGNFDKVSTTFSPTNDVMFGLKVAINMFNEWYHRPVISKDEKPVLIQAAVHLSISNAYWSSGRAVFGDSLDGDRFNPFTSLDTVVHELNHGFTEQHSGLVYTEQSGGLNESFSDMAGITGEYYAYGKTDFLVGWGDEKRENVALRYMDKPSRDCSNRTLTRECSIDTVSQYYKGLGVHYSSGIFNHVYYVLANTTGWDPRKAFEVMLKANADYWTPNTTFQEAACGVMKATEDYRYSRQDVTNAFASVGLAVSDC